MLWTSPDGTVRIWWTTYKHSTYIHVRVEIDMVVLYTDREYRDQLSGKMQAVFRAIFGDKTAREDILMTRRPDPNEVLVDVSYDFFRSRVIYTMIGIPVEGYEQKFTQFQIE